MRLIFRFQFALVFTCLLATHSSQLAAQQASKPGQRPAQPATSQRPVVQKASTKNEIPPKQQDADDDDEHEKMLARLDQILKLWETESSKIKSLHGEQSRSEFNHVFEVEKVTEGKFFLETPDKGRIDLKPIKIKEDATSRKKVAVATGEAPRNYKLVTGEVQSWICDGESIVILNENTKEKSGKKCSQLCP